MRKTHFPTIAVLATSLFIAACGPANTSPTASPLQATTQATAAPPPTIESAPTNAASAEPTAAPEPAATLEATAPAAEPTPSAPPNTPELTRTLSLQTPPLQGDDVRAVQQQLSQLGYNDIGEIDGIFGTKTEQAVRAFQTASKLTVDGIVGTETWAALFGQLIDNPAVIPIIDADTNWLIGATEQGRWISAADAKQQIGRRNYTLLSSKNETSTAGGSLSPSDLTDICPDLVTIKLEPDIERLNTIGVGSGISYSLQPRPVTLIDLKTTQYNSIIADTLGVVGLPNANIGLVQAYQTDIEGDGTQEIILVAEHRADGTEHVTPSTKAGDYSAVLIIKAGKATLLAYDVQTKDVEFSAPLEFRVLGVADLNGDTRMDLVVSSAYYEGSSTSVYDLLPEGAREVLSTGCGV